MTAGRAVLLLSCLVAFRGTGYQGPVGETEPNNAAATANRIAPGDSVTGVINPNGDEDNFAIDLAGGTDLHVDIYHGGQHVGLVDSAGASLAVRDNEPIWHGTSIRYRIRTSGRYYIRVSSSYMGYGGPTSVYRLRAVVTPVSSDPIVREIEPNQWPNAATPADLGNTLRGIIDTATDEDIYSLYLEAGTNLELDLDAQSIGSPLDAFLTLTNAYNWGIDNGNYDGRDPHIWHTITESRRYFVIVRGGFDQGGPDYRYQIKVRTAPPPPTATGPGDPTSVFVSGPTIAGTPFRRPMGVVGGDSGTVFVLDAYRAVYRISEDRKVAEWGPDFLHNGAIARDGFGDLLVPSGGDSTITRVTRPGGLSTFGSVTGVARSIAIGPDGDVWIGGQRYITRFSPLGDRKERIDVAPASLTCSSFQRFMAFSPSGELHYTTGVCDTVFKLVNNVPTPAFVAPGPVNDMAFDQDGYLYVAVAANRRILLYDPNYRLVNATFAGTNFRGGEQGTTYLAFLRDAQGRMTSRLIASTTGFEEPPYAPGILEVNPAGVRAPGWDPVGLRIPRTAFRMGVPGFAYRDSLVASTGAPTTWSLLGGSLPPGIALAPSGALTGVPEQPGQFNFMARATTGTRAGFGRFSLVVTTHKPTFGELAAEMLGATLAPGATHWSQYLDQQGNGDGVFDVGDLRAFMQVDGTLP